MIWKKMKLGDVFGVIKNGASIKQGDGKSGIPITRIETISNGVIDYSKLGYADITDNKYEDYYLKQGDILMSHINSWTHLGKTAIVNKSSETIIHGMNLLLLRGNENLHSQYSKYFFETHGFKDQLHKISNQSVNQSSFATTKLKELLIPLPPLPTQQRIAAILDKADELRKKDKKLLARYDALLQSVFYDMFGDPILNEKGWEIKTLGECSEKIQIGPFGTQLHVEDYIEGGIPLINPTHIIDGKIVEKTNFSISKEKFLELKNYHLKEGDVIMGRRGEMGRCALIGEREDGWICGTGSLFIRLNKKNNSNFLQFILTSKPIKKYLEGASLGVTMANLNLGIVSNIPIISPNITLQNKFASIAQNIQQQKQQVKQQMEQSEKLFQGLLQQAFSGVLVA